MKGFVFITFVLFFSSFAFGIQWQDCGIPLTRKIYYQGVVVSPSSINISSQTSDNSISVNVNAQLKDYTLQQGSIVNLQVVKDGDIYFNGPVGDLCQILSSANGVSCPLVTGPYSFTYQYALPPLPTGNYSITITTSDSTSGAQIGCLSVQNFVMGLGLDQCSYTSSLSASFTGAATFLSNNTVIQIGPWGPNGMDLGYKWGTFKSISASPDLVGYAFRPDNYVWGLTGSINTSVSYNRFDGTLLIGYRPDVTSNQNAQLVYQGTFSWTMTPNPDDSSLAPPYTFQSGTFSLVPTYFFPNNFPYPLNLGNLGPFSISTSQDGSSFMVSASHQWCRCNCAYGGFGKDKSLSQNTNPGMSNFEKGTIAICIIGGMVFIVIVVAIVKIQRSRPRPVVYDEADLMDPQKPDYGSMAINEAFDAEDHEYA